MKKQSRCLEELVKHITLWKILKTLYKVNFPTAIWAEEVKVKTMFLVIKIKHLWLKRMKIVAGTHCKSCFNCNDKYLLRKTRSTYTFMALLKIKQEQEKSKDILCHMFSKYELRIKLNVFYSGIKFI